jgi:hypothetical protein
VAFTEHGRVVRLHRIAVLNFGPLIVCDARLKRYDAQSCRVGFAHAGARENVPRIPP